VEDLGIQDSEAEDTDIRYCEVEDKGSQDCEAEDTDIWYVKRKIKGFRIRKQKYR
jgi:hypothetical protein